LTTSALRPERMKVKQSIANTKSSRLYGLDKKILHLTFSSKKLLDFVFTILYLNFILSVLRAIVANVNIQKPFTEG
jgi:hypothetical protein